MLERERHSSLSTSTLSAALFLVIPVYTAPMMPGKGKKDNVLLRRHQCWRSGDISAEEGVGGEGAGGDGDTVNLNADLPEAS